MKRYWSFFKRQWFSSTFWVLMIINLLLNFVLGTVNLRGFLETFIIVSLIYPLICAWITNKQGT